MAQQMLSAGHVHVIAAVKVHDDTISIRTLRPMPSGLFVEHRLSGPHEPGSCYQIGKWERWVLLALSFTTNCLALSLSFAAQDT
jgi:hypothetical protein